MIRLYNLLFESKEESALDYLGKIIKDSPFAGKVFLAGGAVRDEILGKPVKDIDVVVTMPDGGIAFANWITRRLGVFKQDANPVTFPKFGTAKFNLRGVSHNGIDLSMVDIECVMTRGETYEPGSRKPEVSYADLKSDAFRRDLTVNTLYKDLMTGEIMDLTGRGIQDIQDGVVRTPLDPDTTFQDDPLRMLRAVRFAVKYDWKMSMTLVDSMKRNADSLKNISAERIQDELNKILMTDNPDKGLKLLSYTGLNKHVIPELDLCRNVTQNVYHKDDVFDHILEVVKNTPKNITARLGALFHDIGKPQTRTVGEDNRIHFYEHEDVGADMATAIMKRLKYAGDITNSVNRVVKHHMRLKSAGPEGISLSDKALRRFMADSGEDLDVQLMVMQADNVSHSEIASMPNQIAHLTDRMKILAAATPTGSKPTLPINGNDIMKTLGIKPGPIVKNLLQAVEDEWYADPTLNANDALGIAKMAYEKLTGSQTSDTDVMNKTVKNTETGNDILVKTALKYDDTHPAKIAAVKLIKK